jgi:hypothetical protein
MTITGLTDRQVQICDMLWACDTQEDVAELMSILPAVEARQAETLMQIMIMEDREQELSLMERYPDAEAMIERLKKDYL